MRSAVFAIVLMCFTVAAMAEDPNPTCVVTATPAADDGYFGYPYNVSASCDHVAHNLYVGLGAGAVDPNGQGADAGYIQCNDTTTCSGLLRLSCLSLGSYRVGAGVSGLFLDTVNPSTGYYHDFNAPAGTISVGDKAHFSLSFRPNPDHPEIVQVVVTYSLPQQYVTHGINLSTYPEKYGVLYASYDFSPPLKLSGQYVSKLGLTPGYIITVQPSGCFGGTFTPGDDSSIMTTVPSVSSDVTVVASVATDASPTPEKKAAVGGGVTMSVPLGAIFDVGLIKSATQVQLSSTYAFTSNEPQAPLFRKALFQDRAVIAYSPDDAATKMKFQAVHLGKAILSVRPTDPSVGGVIVTINVTNKARYGSVHNDWDQRFLTVAHQSGIPPQMVKGNVAQESNGITFDPKNYRYEPCGADLNYISSNRNPAMGGPMIGRSPYSLYRAPDPRGSDLQTDDLSARNAYYLGEPGSPGRRHITDGDVNVTARQIFDGNDVTSHDRNGKPHGQMWSAYCSPSTRSLIEDDDAADILDFVAQTPTAASYGLFQMMYETCVEEWSGVNDPAHPGSSSKAPRYLFDTDANLALGGGTLSVANQYHVKHYLRLGAPLTFDAPDDFVKELRLMYQAYNSKKVGYGADVITKSKDYVPIRTGSIFQ